MEFFVSALVLTGIAVLLASSFNLIIGFAGLVSIAHPIFFALGAYTSALLSLSGAPVPLAMLCGVLLAGVASLAMSVPALRVSGDYLVIASIGFQLGVLQIIKNLDFTGGPGGLGNIPALWPDFGATSMFAEVILVWLCALAAIAVVWWLTRSAYGRAITAMRDDEEAFRSVGRGPTRIKVTLFAIACMFAGLGGTLYAHYYLYLSPDQFALGYSAAILTMVVVGGIRTIAGPVLGAVLLQILPQAINFLGLPSSVTGPLQGLIFTGLVLIFLFWRPQGLLGPRLAGQKIRTL